MIIPCPACGAQFQASVEQLGPSGRKVRCGKCAHEWRAVPESDAAAAALAATIETGTEADAEADAEPAPPPPPPTIRRAAGSQANRPAKRRSGLWAAWLILLVLVASLVTGLVVGREAIVHSVPAMAKLYDLVGLAEAEPGDGLTLENVRSVRRLVGQEKHLFVQGDVVNTASGARRVPPLKVVFIDTAGAELASWTFEALVPSLQPGEATSFQTSTQDPPEGAASLTVDFLLEE